MIFTIIIINIILTYFCHILRSYPECSSLFPDEIIKIYFLSNRERKLTLKFLSFPVSLFSTIAGVIQANEIRKTSPSRAALLRPLKRFAVASFSPRLTIKLNGSSSEFPWANVETILNVYSGKIKKMQYSTSPAIHTYCRFC